MGEISVLFLPYLELSVRVIFIHIANILLQICYLSGLYNGNPKTNPRLLKLRKVNSIINRIVTAFESCNLYLYWNVQYVEFHECWSCFRKSVTWIYWVCNHNWELQSSRESMNPTTKIKIRDAAKNLSTVLVEVDLRCRQKVTLDSVGQRKRKQEIVTKLRRRLIRTEGPGRKLRIRQSQDKTMKRKGKSSGLFQVLTKFIKRKCSPCCWETYIFSRSFRFHICVVLMFFFQLSFTVLLGQVTPKLIHKIKSKKRVTTRRVGS